MESDVSTSHSAVQPDSADGASQGRPSNELEPISSAEDVSSAQMYCTIGLTPLTSALHDTGTAAAIAAAVEACFENLFEEAISCHVQRGRTEPSRTWREGRLICRDVQTALRKSKLSALLTVASLKSLVDQFLDSTTALALGIRAAEAVPPTEPSTGNAHAEPSGGAADDDAAGDADGEARDELDTSHASASLSLSTLGGSGTRAQWNKRQARGPFSPPAAAGADFGAQALTEREVVLLLKRVHCAYCLANDALTFALALGRELLRLSGVGESDDLAATGSGAGPTGSATAAGSTVEKGSLAWVPAAIGDRASSLTATLLAAMSGTLAARLPPTLPVKFTLLQGTTAKGSWTTSIPRSEALHPHLEAACRNLQVHADSGPAAGGSGFVTLSTMVPLWGWTTLEGSLSPADYGMVAYPAAAAALAAPAATAPATSAAPSSAAGAAASGGSGSTAAAADGGGARGSAADGGGARGPAADGGASTSPSASAASAAGTAATVTSTHHAQAQALQPVRIWLMPRSAFEHLRREEARRGVLTGAAGVTSGSLRLRQAAMKALRDGASSRIDNAPPASSSGSGGALAVAASASAVAAAAAASAAASASAAVARLRKGDNDGADASGGAGDFVGVDASGDASRGRGRGRQRGPRDGSAASASASASASPPAPKDRASLSPSPLPAERSPQHGRGPQGAVAASVTSPGRATAALPLSAGPSPSRASVAAAHHHDDAQLLHAHAPTYRPVPASAATRLPMLAPAKMAALLAPHVSSATAAATAAAAAAGVAAPSAGEQSASTGIGSGASTATVSPAASSAGVSLPPATGSRSSPRPAPSAATSASSSASASAGAPSGGSGSGPSLHPLVWQAVRIAAGEGDQSPSDAAAPGMSNSGGLPSVAAAASGATVAPPPRLSTAGTSAAVSAAAELARPSSAAARMRLIKTPLVGWRQQPGAGVKAAAAASGGGELRSTGGLGASSRNYGEHDADALALLGGATDAAESGASDVVAGTGAAAGHGSRSGGGGMVPVYGAPDLSRLQTLPPASSRPDFGRRFRDVPPAAGPVSRLSTAAGSGALPPLSSEAAAAASAAASSPGSGSGAAGKRVLKPAPPAGAATARERRAPRLLGKGGDHHHHDDVDPLEVAKSRPVAAAGGSGSGGSAVKAAEDLLSASGTGSPGRHGPSVAASRGTRASAPPAASNRRGSAASAAAADAAGPAAAASKPVAGSSGDAGKLAADKSVPTPRKPAVPGRRVAGTLHGPSSATATTASAAAAAAVEGCSAPPPPPPPTVSLSSVEGKELARKGSSVAPALRSAADTLASLGGGSSAAAGQEADVHDGGTGGVGDAAANGAAASAAASGSVDLNALRDALTTARAAAGDMLSAVDKMLLAKGHGPSAAASGAAAAASGTASASAAHGSGRSKPVPARSRASRSPRPEAAAARHAESTEPVAVPAPPANDAATAAGEAVPASDNASSAPQAETLAPAAPHVAATTLEVGSANDTKASAGGVEAVRPERKGTITSTAAIAPGLGFRADTAAQEL